LAGIGGAKNRLDRLRARESHCRQCRRSRWRLRDGPAFVPRKDRLCDPFATPVNGRNKQGTKRHRIGATHRIWFRSRLAVVAAVASDTRGWRNRGCDRETAKNPFSLVTGLLISGENGQK